MNTRYEAIMVGSAIGDALGMPVEGWKAGQIKKYVGKITTYLPPQIPKDENNERITHDEFGKLKSWTEKYKQGEYTDDTELSLAIAKALSTHGLDLNESAKQQLHFFDQDPEGGFGGTTRLAFQNLKNGISPYNSGVIGGPGTGPCMKIAPLGIYMHRHNIKKSGQQFAKLIGRMTHLDPRSIASGVIQATAVYNLLNQTTKQEFLNNITQTSKTYETPLTEKFNLINKGTLTEKLEWVQNNQHLTPKQAHNYLKSSSNVYSAYPFTIFMFQKFWDQPMQGLIETVNFGGDCDTTAAMYGALAGAKNGVFYPKNLENELNNLALIKQSAKDLYDSKPPFTK